MQSSKSLEGILSSIALLCLLVIILLQVLVRVIPGFSIVWTEELSRWIWVWVVCLGWGGVERDGQHLQMIFLVQKLPRKLRAIIILVLDIIYMIVLVELFFIARIQVLRTIDSRSVTLPFNQHMLYVPLLVSTLCVLLRVVVRIWRRIKSFPSDATKSFISSDEERG